MQKKGITPEQILLELELLETGYEKICTHTDTLGTKIIMSNGEKFVIISVNYDTLKPHYVILDRKTVEKMFMYGKEE